MGRALIDLVRARHAPSRLSTAWAAAARLTPAERLARDASLRWERAAAELEDLIRARRPAREPRAASADVDPDPLGEAAPPLAPETPPRRAGRAGLARCEPVRRGRLVDAMEEARPRGRLRDRDDIAADAIEERRWFREPAGSVPPGIARPRFTDPASVEPGTDRGGEPLPEWPLASRRRGPRAGTHDAGTGAAARRPDPGLPTPMGRGPEPLPSGIVPVPEGCSDAALVEDLGVPRREAEPEPLASPARTALPERLPAPGDVHRALHREHGPVTPAGAGRHPGRPEAPGLRLDILLEDARRRAESIEDWEATGF